MAEKRTGPRESARRGKRAAPTIDLTATEVTPPPSEPAAEPSPPPLPEQTAQAQPAAEPPYAPPPPEPPPVASAGTPPPDEPPVGAEPPTANGGLFHAKTLVAGAAGAALTAVVLFAMWLTGLVPIRYAGTTATRARVTALEMQMHDLQNKPAPAIDSKAIDALGQRVAKLEQGLAKLPPGDATLNDRLSAAENAMKSLGVALSALSKRAEDSSSNATQARERAEAAEKAVADLRASVQDVAKNAAKSADSAISAGELDALQKRLATLEQSTKDARDEIAKTATADSTTRRALAASALRDAVESGAPYSAELAQAQALSDNDTTLAPLTPFAAAGVPSAQALAQELRALLPALNNSLHTQPSGNFLERLQANAGKLVRVTPVNAPVGDDPSTVLARLEVEASKADIAGALADLGKLDNAPLADASRLAVRQWIAKAKARDDALNAARQFAAGAARALGAR